VATDTEQWAPVPSWEGLYEVSTHGRVRRLRRTDAQGRTWKERIVKLRVLGKQIPYRVVLLNRDARVEYRLVHRLVLAAFVGPCPAGMEGCHYPDRNPANNCLSNLRWDTRSSNQRDRAAHGTSNQGERQWTARLTSTDIRAMFEMRRAGARQRQIAERFGVDSSHVSKTLNGKRWAHLGFEGLSP